MGNVFDHPRKPPRLPLEREDRWVSPEELQARTANIRQYFLTMTDQYRWAVQTGRLDAWREAVHAYVDLVSDAP